MIFKKVLQPNRWILLCMPPMSFAALVFIFEIQNTKSKLAYLVYCMSAYSLIIWISALPKMIKRMKSDIRNSKIMQKYRKMMNTITGGFVYGIVIVIAITMLLHSKKSQKKVESIE